MQSVPRHRFVPAGVRGSACVDCSLPIGLDRTISQPYIVACMADLLAVEKHHRVLESRTGSGYRAAVLASLADYVFGVEFVPEPAKKGGQDCQEPRLWPRPHPSGMATRDVQSTLRSIAPW